jgi:hypothetical protein
MGFREMGFSMKYIDTLKANEKKALQGFSTMRAFQRGLIPRLMDLGFSLPDAIREAEKDNLVIYCQKTHNLVVDGGKGLACKLLTGVETTGITFHAIGTGTTAPSRYQTALVTESARKSFVVRGLNGSTGLEASVFYLASECTFNLKEAGVFGGASASITPGSGTMFARYLQSYDNSGGLVDLTYTYSAYWNVPWAA